MHEGLGRLRRGRLELAIASILVGGGVLLLQASLDGKPEFSAAPVATFEAAHDHSTHDHGTIDTDPTEFAGAPASADAEVAAFDESQPHAHGVDLADPAETPGTIPADEPERGLVYEGIVPASVEVCDSLLQVDQP